MKKNFVTNLLLIILLNLLIKPIWIFGIDRSVQVMVGKGEFGLYITLFNLSLLLNILLDFGITNFNNRNISQNHQLLQKHFSSLVLLKFILALVYGVVVFAIAFLLGYTSGRELNLLAFMVINQLLISFTLYLRSNIAGMQMHTVNSLISVLDRTLMTIFCAVLLWGRISGFRISIEWFVYAQTAAYLLTAIICFLIVAAKSRFSRFRFDRKFFLVILKQSAPFALLTLLMAAYTRMDVIMLEKLINRDAAGLYQNGFRLFDAAYQFALLFAVLLLPMFSKMIKDKQNIHELTLLSSLLLFIPVIAMAVGAQVYRVEIMDLLYVENIRETSAYLGILMTAFLGMAGTIIYGTLLTANGNLRELNITSAIALGINIVLNLLLIPKYQGFGAAIACLATQGFAGISQFVISARKFQFRLNARLIIKLIIYIAGTILMGIGLNHLQLPWWIGFLGLLAAAMILAFSLNLINIRGLVKMVIKT